MKIGRIDIDWVMASEARPDINELQVRAHYCVYRINKNEVARIENNSRSLEG